MQKRYSYLEKKQSFPDKEIIRTLCDKVGGQRALARKLGKSQPYISKLINNPKIRVSVDFAKLIAKTFNIPVKTIRPDIFQQNY